MINSLPPPLFSCRYLVDTKWLKQWKKYVGFDSWDSFSAGDQSANPGPIDNKTLFKGKHYFAFSSLKNFYKYKNFKILVTVCEYYFQFQA